MAEIASAMFCTTYSQNRFATISGQISFFLDGRWRDKGAKSFALTIFVLFAEFCCCVGAKSWVLKRSTRRKKTFLLFPISDNRRHNIFKNSKIQKMYLVLSKSSTEGMQLLTERPISNILIFPSKTSWARILAISPRAHFSEKCPMRRKTQITTLFFCTNTCLLVGFNWKQNIVGVQGKLFHIQQQLCENPFRKMFQSGTSRHTNLHFILFVRVFPYEVLFTCSRPAQVFKMAVI